MSRPIRQHCVFTTHTAVPAEHDRFEMTLVSEVLGPQMADGLEQLGCLSDGVLNMTVLGMFFSGFVRSVAQRHREVSRRCSPRYRMHAITNGVHVPTWVAPSTPPCSTATCRLAKDNNVLRYVSTISLDQIGLPICGPRKRCRLKWAPLGTRLDPEALTVGVARRATPYRRNSLLLSRLRSSPPFPADGPAPGRLQRQGPSRATGGKVLIERINAAARELAGEVTVVYLKTRDESCCALPGRCGRLAEQPVPPYEASDTA